MYLQGRNANTFLALNLKKLQSQMISTYSLLCKKIVKMELLEEKWGNNAMMVVLMSVFADEMDKAAATSKEELVR